MFDQLQFKPHILPMCLQATEVFESGWKISVVTGPKMAGLYGNTEDGTYEVAIINPKGNMTEDVRGQCTEEEVSAIMWVLSQI